MSLPLTRRGGCGRICFVTDRGVLSFIGNASHNFIFCGNQPASRTPAICDKKYGAWDGLFALRGNYERY